MMPSDPKDVKAGEWFNSLLKNLEFGQDYYIYPGSAKKMMEDGKQVGLSIVRPDVRLYETGVTKLYEMLVEGKELPDIEYTEEQEKKFDEELAERFPEAFTEEE